MLHCAEIDADLSRKFKNRRDSEYRYLDKLKAQHLAPQVLNVPGVPAVVVEAVVESPRRPKYAAKDTSKKENVWMGRKRRSAEAFLKHTSVTITQSGSSGSVNIRVTSPKKRILRHAKEQKLPRQSLYYLIWYCCNAYLLNITLN